MNREIIKVYNIVTLERVGLLEDYKSFQFSEKYGDAGSFTIKLAYNKKYDEFIGLKSIIKYKDFDGIVTGVQKTTAEDGTTEMVIVGMTLNWLLSMRINIKINMPYRNKTLTEIITMLLNDNFIRPEDNYRKIDMLEIGSITGLPTAAIDSHTVEFHENIFNIIKNLAEIYEFNFKITFDEKAKKCKFYIYYNTKEETKIGTETDNLLQRDYTLSLADYKNVAYVDAIIDYKRMLKGVNLLDFAGINRFETIVAEDVKKENEETEEDFIARYLQTAEAAKNGQVTVYDAEVDANRTNSMELGEKVVIKDEDYNFRQVLQVNEIETTVENGIVTINYIFGKDIKLQKRG